MESAPTNPEPQATQSSESQRPAVNPHLEAYSYGGASVVDLLGSEAAETCVRFIDDASTSHGGYGAVSLSNTEKQLLDNAGRAHTVGKFPGAKRFQMPSGYTGRGYIIGKYGDPEKTRPSDGVLVLCEDGRLRGTTVLAVESVLGENIVTKDTVRTKYHRLKDRFQSAQHSHQDQKPGESTEFQLGILQATSRHGVRFHSVGKEEGMKTTLERASGKNFSVNILPKDYVLGPDGKPLSQEEAETIQQLAREHAEQSRKVRTGRHAGHLATKNLSPHLDEGEAYRAAIALLAGGLKKSGVEYTRLSPEALATALTEKGADEATAKSIHRRLRAEGYIAKDWDEDKGFEVLKSQEEFQEILAELED